MGRLVGNASEFGKFLAKFPMIPPQVNGATVAVGQQYPGFYKFPMIPPQVNGATIRVSGFPLRSLWFPMIPPQVNGATVNLICDDASYLKGFQ